MLTAPMLGMIATIDAKLAALDVPPLAPWWREQLGRWHASGRRRFVGRVGRGGIKSHTAVKVSAAATLGGAWRVPRGERHYFAFVSQNKSEAGQRLHQLGSWLRALGVPFTSSGDEIALGNLPLGFRVFACQVGAVSGFRCVGFVADELAKWSAEGTDPGPEVIASLRAMTVTHPDAVEFCISSAFGTADTHCQMFELGDTDDQVVASAPTWVANPSVTEADTRLLEPDHRVWSREYLGEPQAAVLAAFDPEAVDAAFVQRDVGRPGRRVMVLDPSSGKRDSFTWAVAGWNRRDDGTRLLVFDLVDGVDAKRWGKLTGADLVEHAADVAHERGVRLVLSDQRESMMLKSEFHKHELSFRAIDWTSSSKPPAVERLRRLLDDRLIVFPEHAALRRELLAFEEKITTSGQPTFGARTGRHDDHVALAVTLCMADLRGKLSGSPVRSDAGEAYARVMQARRRNAAVTAAEVRIAKQRGELVDVGGGAVLVGTGGTIKVKRRPVRQGPAGPWQKMGERMRQSAAQNAKHGAGTPVLHCSMRRYFG